MLQQSEYVERKRAVRAAEVAKAQLMGAGTARLACGLRRGVWAAGMTLVATLASAVLAMPALAVCDVTGTTVTCAENTPEGFQAGVGVLDLTVEVVEGVTVGDAGGSAAISVNPGSLVTNNGTIIVGESGSVGLFGTLVETDDMGVDDEPITLTNGETGLIVVTGAGGAGMRAEERPVLPGRTKNDPRITLRNDGEIQVNVDAGIAMDATDHGFANNTATGQIFLGAEGAPVDGAVGLSGGVEKAILQNLGLIKGYGDSLTGMVIGDDNVGKNVPTLNQGIIELNGDNAIGMDAGSLNDNQVEFRNGGSNSPGTISIVGANGIGMRAGDDTDLRNLGLARISVQGTNAIGIQVGDGSLNTSNVVSQGTIDVDGEGAIGIDAGSDRQLISNNFGTITVNRRDESIGQFADSFGIKAGDSNRVLNKDGAIVVDGTNARGVSVGSDSSLENDTAIIDVTGMGAIGVEFGSGGSLENDLGSITVEGDDARGVSFGNDGLLTNSTGSSITVEGDGARGVSFGSDGLLTNSTGSSILATGSGARGVSFGTAGLLINQEAIIEAVGDGAIGVEFSDGFNQFQNFLLSVSADNPIVRATGAGAIAVKGGSGADIIENGGGVFSAMGDNSIAVDLGDGENVLDNVNADNPEVTVRGVVRALGLDGSISGLAVLGGVDNDLIRNEGDIEGDIDLGAGNDTFRLKTSGSWTGSMGGGFIEGGPGIDGVEFYGSGETSAPSLDAFRGFESLLISQGGTWSLGGNGDFELVEVEGAPAENTIVVIETPVTLTGSYTQGPDTSLEIVVGDIETISLQVADEFLISSVGTTLYIDLSDATGDFRDALGEFTIITSGGSLDGEFEYFDFIGNSFVSGDIEYFANSVVVILEFQGFLLGTETPNQEAVGTYLSTDVFAAEGDYLATLEAISKLSEEDFLVALDQLSAEVYDSQANAMLSWGRAATRALEQRPVRCQRLYYVQQPGVHSKKPCGKKGWTPWLEAVGISDTREGDAGFLSFKNTGGGVLLGVDRRYGERVFVSLNLGSGRIRIKPKGIGTGTLQTLDAGASVGVRLGDGYLRAIASYSHGWHTTRRDIDFLSTRAIGEHGSNRITTVVDAGYTFEWKNLFFEPVASLRYSYLGQDRVSESGAPGADLLVAARSNSIFSTALGGRLYTSVFKYDYVYDWLEWADGVWTPELNFRWRRVFSGANRHVNAVVQGAPTSIPAFRVDAEDAQYGLEYGLGVRFQPIDSRASVVLGYSGFWGDGALNHHLGVNVRVPF